MAYWLIKEIKNPEEYNKAIEKICWLYALASELKEIGITLISTDEKTSIQALEKKILPMKKGYHEKHDSEYIRHGTFCLIANLEIATGKIISPSLTQTRTEQDFLAHISKTAANYQKCIFVSDNLNTHLS